MGILEGKSAVVTGAASGMGRATALAMVSEGATVLAVDIDSPGLARLAAEIGGESLETAEADISDPGAARDVVRAAERRFGTVNVLSTGAAVARPAAFLAMTAADWQAVMAVNAFGVVAIAQAAIPVMRAAGGGSIVTWGSIGSVVAEEGFAAYCASKGAVLMVTKTIALEHAGDRIRANCLCPGMVDTPMASPYIPSGPGERAEFVEDVKSWQPLGLGDPEQLASIAVFLASERSSFMTGSVVMADGGFTAM